MLLMEIKILLTVLALILLCIALSKETKNPYIVLAALISSIVMLVHSIMGLSKGTVDQATTLYYSIAIEYALVLMSYLAYLWIDDLHARKENIKSLDNSLSWLWGVNPEEKSENKKENKKVKNKEQKEENK